MEKKSLTVTKEDKEYWFKTLYHPKINSREGILRISKWFEETGVVEKDPFPLFEKIGGGTYTREVHIPKGYGIVGRIHKNDSMVYVLKGALVVATENGTKTITAPAQFVSKKGIKKVAFILEDTIWIDIHGTGAETTEDAEKQVFCDTYEEYEYAEMITNMGLTQDEVTSITENHSDLVADSKAEYIIHKSELHGKGIFAAKDYVKGESVGVSRIGNSRTIMGRYTNHLCDNNCECEIQNDKALFVANKLINAGEEITVNYQSARSTAQELDRVTLCQE